VRQRVILAVAAVPIAYVYLLALTYATGFAISVFPPRWWLAAFPSSGTAVLSWVSFAHTLAVVVVSVPFAWVIGRLYGRLSLYVAIAVGVVIWLLFETPAVIDLVRSPRFRSFWFADTLVFVLALPSLVWLLGKLPSNNRWRGP
jgi:hypothetical protein